MTTALFLLRCIQIGLSIRDLDLLTTGMVNDLYKEIALFPETYEVSAPG